MSIKSIFKSFRMISLTATFTPWIASLLISKIYFDSINYTNSILALIGILFLQIGVNLYNDVSDFKRGIDNTNEFGGSGVLVSGELSYNQVQLMALFFFISASFIAYFIAYNNVQIIPVIVLGAFASFLYSLPFFGLKYIALGDVAVFIGCGPVLTYGFALSSGQVHLDHIIVGIFFGLMAIGILHVNNMEDIKIDTHKKVKTIATIIGFRNSKIFLNIVYLLSFLSLFLLNAKIGNLPLALSLISLPMGIKIIKTFAKAQSSEDKEVKLLRISAAQFHLSAGILLCLGLTLKLFI